VKGRARGCTPDAQQVQNTPPPLSPSCVACRCAASAAHGDAGCEHVTPSRAMSGTPLKGPRPEGGARRKPQLTVVVPATDDPPPFKADSRVHGRRSSCVGGSAGGGVGCARLECGLRWRALGLCLAAHVFALLVLLRGLYVVACSRPPLPVVGLPPADEQARAPPLAVVAPASHPSAKLVPHNPVRGSTPRADAPRCAPHPPASAAAGPRRACSPSSCPSLRRQRATRRAWRRSRATG
jgi:hypothetical protein